MRSSWQSVRAGTRPLHVPKLVVTIGTPCHFCFHVRSSHSALVLQAACRVDGCGCPVFDPICGCGHILSEHTWGTQPNPWECAFCPCLRFGANLDGTVEHRPITRVVLPALPPPPPPPAPLPEQPPVQMGFF